MVYKQVSTIPPLKQNGFGKDIVRFGTVAQTLSLLLKSLIVIVILQVMIMLLMILPSLR